MTSAGDPAPSLAASFDLVAPSLPPALIPPARVPELRQLTRRLAPFPRAGFEVRLTSSSEVDVQQWLTTRDHEPQRLHEHIARARWSGPAAERLNDLLSRWSDPADPLHIAVGELWLEFDRPAEPGSTELPPLSLFLALAAADNASAFKTTADALGALIDDASRARTRVMLERCIDACPSGAFVSHIGLMLGRPEPSLRVNVKRLDGKDLPGYLGEIGWPGPSSEAVGVFTQLQPAVDRITICVDIGAAVSPELGLECTLDGQPPENPRWTAFLDELVERGWCLPEKREALVRWPGVTTPANTSGPWPAPLIRQELLHGVDHLSSFERRLSHVKITLGGAQSPQAKAYFGFFHTFLRPPLHHDDPRPRRNDSAQQPDRSGTPVDRAVRFLLAARTTRGWWCDFSGVLGDDRIWRAGASDEWVTAYTGASLASVADADAQQAGRRAWALLTERRPPGLGWGFNRLSPPDADSTAWALALAAALDQGTSPFARRAREALNDHFLSDGGLATYRRDALHIPAADSVGWSRTAHACVTAAAARLGHPGALAFLLRSQGDDGSWSGYWWEDQEYATALAAEALLTAGAPADHERVAAAVAWARGRIGPDGSVRESAFATALCARILNLATDPAVAREDRRRSLGWLAAHQRPDGSWAPSARLRVPRPHVTDPAGGEDCTFTFDEAGVFTTATVLLALAGEPS